MQKYRTLAAIGCLMVLFANAAEFGIGRLPVAQPRRLAVENFPTQIGAWQGGDLEPVDPDVQKRLPTAKLSERVYSGSGQRAADLLLVTASDSEDLHDPNSCFPAQGWRLTNHRQVSLDGRMVNVMEASQDQQDLTVMYWYAGYYAPQTYPNAIVRQLADVRTRLIGQHEGDSLFVRIMVPHDQAQNGTLMAFAHQAAPLIQSLIDSRMTAEERRTSREM